MLRNILTPLDGSTFGEQALPWALTLARKARAELHLLHVHHPLEVTYAEMQVFDSTLDDHLRQRERTYLEATVKNLASAEVPVKAVARDGETSKVIRDHAVENKVDLIVMTTHARGALGRFWLGSVTDELVRDAPAPVLLIHPTDQPPDAKADKAIKNILVPLDGSPLAEQILGPVGDIARLTGADTTLLRVIQPVRLMTLPAGAGSFGEMAQHVMDRIDEIQASLMKEAQDYLDRTAESLRKQGFRVTTKVVSEEQPGVAILRQAVAPVDLIALGTHGRRGLSRLFMGSVADKVIRGAHVPVLVSRPKG